MSNVLNNIALGFKLDLTQLSETAKSASSLMGQVQKAISKVSLQGAVKGDPFAHQKTALKTFETAMNRTLDKLVQQTSKLSDSLRMNFNWDRLFGEVDVSGILKSLEMIETSMNSLEDISKEYQENLAEIREELSKGLITEEQALVKYDAAEAKYAADVYREAAHAADLLSAGYRKLYLEAKNLAGSVKYLTDLQKMRVGAQVVIEEQTAMQRLIETQQRAVQGIQLGINVLENEKKLRKSIIDLAMKGKLPEEETYAALEKVANRVVEIKQQYALLDEVKRRAMRLEAPGGFTLSKEVIEQQRSLLQTTVQTKVEYDKLSKVQKSLFMESQGYGQSLQSLNLTIKELGERVQILKAAKENLFSKDIMGAKELTKDIETLEQRLLRLKIEQADRRGWATASDKYKNDLIASVQEAEKRVVEEEAEAYKKQAGTLEELTAQYQRLAAVKALLETDKSATSQRALTKLYSDQASVVERLATLNQHLTKEQAEQYAFAKYGIQSYDQLGREIVDLERELGLLKTQDVSAVFMQDEKAALRYKDTIIDLESKIIQLKKARGELGGESRLYSAEERASLELQERKLMQAKNEVRLQRERLDAEQRIAQVIDLETKRLQELGVNVSKITNKNLQQEGVAVRITTLYKEMVRAQEQGVKFTAEQATLMKSLEKYNERILAVQRREAGVFTLDRKRMLWFAQLRAYWGVYQVLSEAVRGAVDFEQAMAEVSAVASATEKEIGRLITTSMELGTRFRFSAAEIGKGAVTIAQAGYSAIEAVQMIEATASLAAATLASMEMSSNLMTTTMKAWNMDASKAARVADIFASAVNNSKLRMDGLVTAFNYVTGVAPSLNMSLEESVGALAQMANAGLNASIAGTSFRAMLASIMAPNERFIRTLRSVGLTLEDVDPEVRHFSDILKSLKQAGFDVTKAFEGLERRASTGINIMIENADTYDTMVSRMYEFGIAEEMAERNMKTLQSRWTQFKNVVSVSMYDAFEPLSNTLQDILTSLGPLVELLGAALRPISTLTDAVLKPLFWAFDMLTKRPIDFKLDESDAAISALREDLLKVRHALVDIENQITRVAASYAQFRKQLLIGRFGVERRTPDQLKLAEARSRLRALEVAEKLGKVERSIVLTYKEQYEELEKTIALELETGKARIETAERLASLNKALAKHVNEIKSGYEAELFAMLMVKKARQEQEKRSAEDILAKKLEKIVTLYHDIAENTEKAMAARDLGKALLMPVELYDFAKRVKDIDTLGTSLEELTKVLNEMTTVQADAFFERVASSLGVSVDVLRSNITVMKALVDRYNKEYERLINLDSKAQGKETTLGLAWDFMGKTSRDAALKEVAVERAITSILPFTPEELAKQGKTASQAIVDAARGIQSETERNFMKASEDFMRALLTGTEKQRTDLATIFLQTIPTDELELTDAMKSRLKFMFVSMLNATKDQAGDMETRLREILQGLPEHIIEDLLEILLRTSRNAMDLLYKTLDATNQELESVVDRIHLFPDREQVDKDFDRVLSSIEQGFAEFKQAVRDNEQQSVNIDFGRLRDSVESYGKMMKDLIEDTMEVNKALELFKTVVRGLELEEILGKMTDEELTTWLVEMVEGKKTIKELAHVLGLSAEEARTLATFLEAAAKKQPGRPSMATAEEAALQATMIKRAQMNLEMEQKKRSLSLDTNAILKKRLQYQRDLLELNKHEELRLRDAEAAFREDLKGKEDVLELIKKSMKEGGPYVSDTELSKIYGLEEKRLADIRKVFESLLKNEKDRVSIEQEIVEIFGKQVALQLGLKVANDELILQGILKRESLLIEERSARLALESAQKLTLTRKEESEQLRDNIKLLEEQLIIIGQQRAEASRAYREAGTQVYKTVERQVEEVEIKRSEDKGKDYETQWRKNLLDLKKLESAFVNKDFYTLQETLRVLKMQHEVLADNVSTQQQATALAEYIKILEDAILDAQKGTADAHSKVISLMKEQATLLGDLADKAYQLKLNSDAWEDAADGFAEGLKRGVKEVRSMTERAQELGEHIGRFQEDLTNKLGEGLGDYFTQFFGQETERMNQLKDKYKELQDEREKALEAGDASALAEVNAQLERTVDLMHKEKRLMTQLAVAWKEFTDIFIQELMRMIAQMIIATAIKAALFAIGFDSGGVVPGPLNLLSKAKGGIIDGSLLTKYSTGGVTRGKLIPVRAYATGGLIEGGLTSLLEKKKIKDFRAFAGGGVTGSPTLALVGDNPSKKELVIPAENIKKDSVEGYVREKNEGSVASPPITVVNVLSPNDIAAAMAQAGGQRVIINTIGQDILKKGPTYKVVKDLGGSR